MKKLTQKRSHLKELIILFVYINAPFVGFSQNGHSMTCLIEDSLWVSKYETTNEQYKSFVNQYEGDSIFLLPNEELFIDCFYTGYYQTYFNQKEFNNYPVVAISFENVQLYCDWLSNNDSIFDYFIPSKSEWLYAFGYQKGLNGTIYNYAYSWGSNSIYSSKGKVMGNLFIPIEYQVGKVLNRIMPVDSYKDNQFSLYNLTGNVSEMISDSIGCGIGGGWLNLPEKATVSDLQCYSGASINLGFRIFARLKK